MDANDTVASSATEPLTSATSTDAGTLATSQTEQATGQPAESSTAQESNDPDDTGLPFHQHPRFKELIEERNTLREQAKIAETFAPFAPLAELARQNGFESFEAMEQARQTMAAQTQAEAEEKEMFSRIEQDIADSRERWEEEGHDDDTIEQLAEGRLAKLVAEASERISETQQHAKAIEAAKIALPNATPELLEIVKIFDSTSVPLVTQQLQSYIESRVASEVEAKAAEWETKRAEQLQTAVPLRGSGGAENAMPPKTLEEIRAMSWRSVLRRPA